MVSNLSAPMKFAIRATNFVEKMKINTLKIIHLIFLRSEYVIITSDVPEIDGLPESTTARHHSHMKNPYIETLYFF